MYAGNVFTKSGPGLGIDGLERYPHKLPSVKSSANMECLPVPLETEAPVMGWYTVDQRLRDADSSIGRRVLDLQMCDASTQG